MTQQQLSSKRTKFLLFLLSCSHAFPNVDAFAPPSIPHAATGPVVKFGTNHNYVNVHSQPLLSTKMSPTASNSPFKPMPMPMPMKRSQSSSSELHSVLNPAVLTASLSATSKLLSSIGIGALATPAGPKQLGNVLDGTAISVLSKLTYWLFQPCFLMCSVAATLAASNGPSTGAGLPKSALMLLPLASLIQISLGSIAAKLLTTKRFGIRPALLGIDTEDEDGASDIRMCTTFANSGPLPLILSDALFRGTVLSDVTACISFYLLIWSPLFWTFGRIILGTNKSVASSSDEGVVDKVVRQAKVFFSPPVVGSILGVIIGLSALLRNLMLKPTGLLSPVFGAAKTFGIAYLPSAVLVLAGSLAGAKKSEPAAAEDGEKKSSTSLSAKTILSIMGSRFILSPILALSTVKLMTLAKLMPTGNARALATVTFTLLMEGCMPPAQNSVIILQLDQEKERAAKMAKMLTVIYAFSAIPVTLLLGGCLSLSGILNFL